MFERTHTKRPYDDRIKSAYHISRNIYDKVLTQKSFLSKLYIRFFWSGTDDNEIAKRVLSFIPEDFSGTLLDVPVGTAVFTRRKWKSLTKVKIICLDYSEDMLRLAKDRLNGCSHISLVLFILPSSLERALRSRLR